MVRFSSSETSCILFREASGMYVSFYECIIQQVVEVADNLVP